MFTNRVANIGPGETVLIEIEYQAPVAVRERRIFAAPAAGGRAALRAAAHAGQRGRRSPTREAVTAPLADPRRTGPLNPVSIEVHLQPGFPIANLTAPITGSRPNPKPAAAG